MDILFILEVSSVMECTLDNGSVFNENGCSKCFYACDDGYKSSGSGYSDMVYCDRKSRRWLLSETGIPPCNIKESRSPTKGFTPLVPQDATGLSLDRLPTVIPDNFQSSNIQLANSRPVNTHTAALKHSVLNDAVIGGTVGSILGMALLIAVVRACIGMRNRKGIHLREERGAYLANIQRVLEERRTEGLQSELEGTTLDNASETGNITDTEDYETDNEGFLILQIRRCLTMPFNPFAAFQNHPEPPPYDAESVSPPAYQESEEANLVAPETSSDNNQPEEPPPPYIDV